jgi:hypothetical protein
LHVATIQLPLAQKPDSDGEKITRVCGIGLDPIGNCRKQC